MGICDPHGTLEEIEVTIVTSPVTEVTSNVFKGTCPPILSTGKSEAPSTLNIPNGFQKRVEEAIRGKAEHTEAHKRMLEIEGVFQRIDFSWEQNFMSP